MSRPTFRHAAKAGSTVAGRDAVALAESVGFHLDSWQRDVLKDWLREGPDGRWLHRRGVLIQPRQNGKSHVAVARVLYGLFLNDERILLSAHRFGSAQNLFRMLADVVENSPDLMGRTKKIHHSHGSEGIQLHSGARLWVTSRVAAMSSVVRGASLDTLVLDEALVLDAEFMSAVQPTLAARPNPQVLLISSGGDASSLVLGQARRAGYDQVEGMCLHEWAADPSDDIDDVRVWRRVNPALGSRITMNAVRDERQVLTPTAFARERLGVWSSGVPEPALQPDAVQKVLAADVGRPPAGAAVLTVDISVDHAGDRFSAIGCAWQGTEGVCALEVSSGPGSDWLVSKVVEVAAGVGVSRVRFAVGSCGDVADALVAAGVLVERVPFATLKGSVASFAEHVGRGTVAVQSSDMLVRAARTAPRKSSPDGTWYFGRGPVPVAGLNAVALAVAGVAAGVSEAPQIW